MTEGTRDVCWIEFTGMPGSGKTTVTDSMVAQGDQIVDLKTAVAKRRRPLDDRLMRYPARLLSRWPDRFSNVAARSTDSSEVLQRFFALRPDLLTVIGQLMAKEPAATQRNARALGWLFSLASEWGLAEASTETPFVVGEGFAHRFISFIDPAEYIDGHLLARYIAAAPQPCMLVHLSDDPSVAIERLRRSNRYLWGRAADMSGAEAHDFYQSMYTASLEIARTAEEAGWMVFRTPNSTPDATAQSILECHREWCGRM